MLRYISYFDNTASRIVSGLAFSDTFLLCFKVHTNRHKENVNKIQCAADNIEFLYYLYGKHVWVNKSNVYWSRFVGVAINKSEMELLSKIIIFLHKEFKECSLMNSTAEAKLFLILPHKISRQEHLEWSHCCQSPHQVRCNKKPHEVSGYSRNTVYCSVVVTPLCYKCPKP